MFKSAYTFRLLIFSAFLFVTAFFAARQFEIPVYYVVLLSVYFTVFSFVLNRKLESALVDANKNKFTHTFLALTALKMFSALMMLLFGLFFTDKDKLALGLCTMMFYMLYTAYEVWYWLAKLKKA